VARTAISAVLRNGAGLIFLSRFSFKHCYLNLIRKGGEMASEPVKHLALGFIGCEIADQGAFGRVFPKFFDLGQVILHGQTPLVAFPEVQSRNKRSQCSERTRDENQARKREPAGLLERIRVPRVIPSLPVWRPPSATRSKTPRWSSRPQNEYIWGRFLFRSPGAAPNFELTSFQTGGRITAWAKLNDQLAPSAGRS
jgi:hypothetical protein